MKTMNWITSTAIALYGTTAVAATTVSQFSDSTGNVNVNTSQPAPYFFNTTDISSNKASVSGSQIMINEAGLYQVMYSLNWGTSDNNRREVKTSLRLNGITELGGSSYGYARREDQAGDATNTSSMFVELQAGDYLELMHVRNSTITNQALSIPGESWISIHQIEASLSDTNPARNCAQILEQNPAASDGIYTIDPDGPGTLGSVAVQCDMTTNGGGWTLVMRGSHLDTPSPTTWATTSSFNLSNANDTNEPTFKMSDNAINALVSEAYRFSHNGYDGNQETHRYFKPTCVYRHTTQVPAGSACNLSYADLNWTDQRGGTSNVVFRGLSDHIIPGANAVTSDSRTRVWFIGAGQNRWISAADGWKRGDYAGHGNVTVEDITNASFTLWVR